MREAIESSFKDVHHARITPRRVESDSSRVLLKVYIHFRDSERDVCLRAGVVFDRAVGYIPKHAVYVYMVLGVSGNVDFGEGF